MKKGFTLIEVLVSVAIFAVVMTIALGALLSMSESDRKAETLKSVINNLNFALDELARTARTGTTYHCGTVPPYTTADCSGSPTPPASLFAFLTTDNEQVYYCLGTWNRDTNTGACLAASVVQCPAGSNCSILRSFDAGALVPMTSTEVSISSLRFYVTGSTAGDAIQPKVTILLSGIVTVNATQTSKFNLQTSVTQRVYDQ